MKPDQMKQAQHLYFQTDLSKTEIAQNIGMSRRTLHHWIRKNDWDKLKKSAEYVPTFLAENCYQILGNLTEHLLSEDRKEKPVTPQEVTALYKLTLAINKLKTRSTVNENMENFTHLSEHIYSKDPELALAIQPYMQDYITAQVAHDRNQYRPAKMQQHGYIPNPDTEKTYNEAKLDEEDFRFWAQQQKSAQPFSAAVASSAKAAPSAAEAPVLSNAEGSNETSCVTPPSPSERAGVRPSATDAFSDISEDDIRTTALILNKPESVIREILNGPATESPVKAYQKSHLAAA